MNPIRVKLSELSADVGNTRVHDVRNIDVIKNSLLKFGQYRPFVVQRSGMIVRVGNGMLAAMLELGWDEGFAEIRDLTDAEAVALSILDNKSAELAMWDEKMLAESFGGIDDDLKKVTGFSDSEIRKILRSADGHADAEAKVDVAEELNRKWGVKRGDVYEIGGHRLMCGDSTLVSDALVLMGVEKAQLCFTSPPYWVGKSYETQSSIDEIKKFIDDISGVICSVMNRDGGRVVINTGTASATAVDPKADAETLFILAWWQDSLRERGWLMRHCRLWVKGGQLAAPRVAARSDVVDQHWESVATFLPTFYCPDGKKRGQEKIGMKWAQQGVWDDIHGGANMAEHGAAFPLELPMRYMRLYSVDAELVFEPFMGTGTTMVACENLARRCFGSEISENYCAVVLERMSEAFPSIKINKVR